MDERIFGSITIPSIPDLQSNCEEELMLLMKEVDFEFQRKHHALLKELDRLRKLCKNQSNVIGHCVVHGDSTISEKEDSAEKIKQCSNEIERLKKENFEIKAENRELKNRTRRLNDIELHLESLKKSLTMQENENRTLRERLSKADEKNQLLQNEYDKITRIRSQGNAASSSNFKDVDINEIIEKISSEDQEVCNKFLKEKDLEIEEFEKKLAKEAS